MTETPPDPSQPPAQPSPPYGAPQGYGAYGTPSPYGAPPAYGVVAPDHPQATTALILGIVGIVVCGFAAPFAWVMGGRVVREIDESRGRLGGRSTANAGRILGIVGTVILALSALFLIGVIGLVVVGVAGSTSSG